MEAIEFRVFSGVLEYRTAILLSQWGECGSSLQFDGYTDWKPVPEVRAATSPSIPSSYDCGVRRTISS